MADFKVLEILAVNKIKTTGWRLHDTSGNIVIIRGLDAKNDQFLDEMSKNRLKILLQDKMVVLKSGEINEKGEIVCDVLLNGVNVLNYFSEFK